MARDPKIKRKLPTIPFPIGSVAELKDLGIEGKDLRTISTCSMPGEHNRGCPMYEACDREWRDQRPQFQVYDEVKSDGSIRRSHAECWFVVSRELVADINGGFVEVVGSPGFKYKYFGSRRLHPKRDPDCTACSEGKCSVYVDDEFEIACPEKPPAAEHSLLRRFGRVVEARGKRNVQVKASRRRTLLRDEGDGEAAS